jgi:digeranylgeranylglycerophospholipid reductase
VVGVKARTLSGDLTIKCGLVIDASGFSSTVVRKSMNASEWKRYGIGAEYECYCDNADPTTWSIMVGEKYSGAGYAWVFPLSKNRVRIGVGIGRPESSSNPLDKLNNLIETKAIPLDEFGRIQPLELHYGFIPNQGTRKTTVFDGLMLVGDSAGQSNPLVLEGIRYAIEFGRLAGRVGAKVLQKQQNFTAESLLEYEQNWKAKVESKIQSALKVQSRWIKLTDPEWDKEIEILRDMTTDEFLDFIKADFSAAKMMKLAVKHPKLAARQLFNLVLKS